MTAGTPVEGTVCVSGVDYFSIEPAEGETATATLTHTALDGELDVYASSVGGDVETATAGSLSADPTGRLR